MAHLIGIETETIGGKEYLAHVFNVSQHQKLHFIAFDTYCNDDIFARKTLNPSKKVNRKIVCFDNLEIYEIVEKIRELGLADYDYQFYAKMVECGLDICYRPCNFDGEIITD